MTGKKYNFCGPGTKLSKRIASDGSFITPTFNSVDKICANHDIAYSKFSDIKYRNTADQKMLHSLDGIYNPNVEERCARTVIKQIISAKKRFGVGTPVGAGIKKQPNLDKSTCR